MGRVLLHLFHLTEVRGNEPRGCLRAGQSRQKGKTAEPLGVTSCFVREHSTAEMK